MLYIILSCLLLITPALQAMEMGAESHKKSSFKAEKRIILPLLLRPNICPSFVDWQQSQQNISIHTDSNKTSNYNNDHSVALKK